MRPLKSVLSKFYDQYGDRPKVFQAVTDWMASGPVVVMLWEGDDVVKIAREMIGDKDPSRAAPGTIRGDYCIKKNRNLIHSSASVEAAKKAIDIWFSHSGSVKYRDYCDPWIFGDFERSLPTF